ncbi:LacI family transcriptional regulator [Mangrovactinospora gilvigrisea]|uniref:LacI family transcriptional regulator n=1 Tax=Mangrovactinospora gilvigrisea TaxID=1428644 RepID=A0A1J7BST2_9ACTN|nr:LacI family DNA-binding transcriptional regulator [Mangrovactinospora gilvigrisea]OIV36521.1 LacI family transcriptional regulator [Mangrovactinospora gilvigrisea]
MPQRNAPGARRPTLSDVAREVGVSAKTVSRVLNEEGVVSPGTRARVLEAVERLGFRPNLMARNVRVGSRDSTVGLIVPELGNPFFGTVAEAVEKALRARGLTLVIGTSEEDAERERQLVRTFLDRQTGGLIVVPAEPVGPHAGLDHAYLGEERAAGLPVVFLDRTPTALAADTVLSENRDGARAGVAHLLGRGHRRIAFLGDEPAELYTRRERFAGYREALAAAGVPEAPELVVSGHDSAAAAAAVRALLALPEPPTALFAANNLATVGAVTALARAGRQDVALVGFDDLPMAEALRPGLTVIAQDPAALGREAAALALARLDGDEAEPRVVRVPTRLVARGSGELRPG